MKKNHSFIRKCPACGVSISVEEFLLHYQQIHLRVPKEGEVFRFVSPKDRLQKKTKGSRRISFFRGGLPSLGKK